jgi:hypothetical protein
MFKKVGWFPEELLEDGARLPQNLCSDQKQRDRSDRFDDQRHRLWCVFGDGIADHLWILGQAGFVSSIL